MSGTIFTNVESAVLNYETLGAAEQVRNIDDIEEPSDRLFAFLNLCQLSEYYCLFENLFVDHEQRSTSRLTDVKDIFQHPSLGVDVSELRIVQKIEELEVEDYESFLDVQLGTGFTEAMINRFLDSLAPQGVGQIKEMMTAIFTYDRGLAIAMCAERYRDILRFGCLETKFSRSNCMLNDKEFPIRPWVFVENQRWQDKLNSLYLPTLEEYATYFDRDDKVSASLDAGRLVRRAYGALVRHLKDVTAIDDNFVASPHFLLPPIATAVLSDIASFGSYTADDYLEHLEVWRTRFVTYRKLVSEFDTLRRGNGPRSKLIKLKNQIDRSIETLTKKRGFSISTKVDMINTDKLADMHLSLDDLKTGSILKLGLDKVREIYDLYYIKPLPSIREKVLSMSNEHTAVKTICHISDADYERHFMPFVARMDTLTNRLSEVFSPNAAR